MTPASTSGLVHERLDPIFFSGGASYLYGCHHVPAVSPASAIVLCAPVGHEYTRCHRAMRQLAAQLAKSGHHAFRFDYTGTGDSAGDYADATLDRWRQDIGDAMDECKRRTRAASVMLIGLRVGAALALQVAALRADVRSLVLWNPVLDGARLLEEWRSAQRAFGAALGHSPDVADREVLGMPLGARLATELRALDVSADVASLERMLVCHDGGERADVDKLAARLLSRRHNIDVREVEQPAIWRQEALDAIVPFPALRTIVEWTGAAQ